jgi:hypothetical protein
MDIQLFYRVDGWLNIPLYTRENQQLFDFCEYWDGKYHTLTEAHELYDEYMKYSKETVVIPRKWITKEEAKEMFPDKTKEK